MNYRIETIKGLSNVQPLGLISALAHFRGCIRPISAA